MNLNSVLAVAKRDLRNVKRSRGVLLPLIIVPLIFVIILPVGLGLGAPFLSNLPASNLEQTARLVEQMPPAVQEQLAPYDTVQKMLYVVLVFLFAPMFLILPLMVSSVIAADSFAGEKERKTLEALLYTPTTDAELFLGKVLAAWIPAVLVAFAGFIVYAVCANVAAWPTMGHIFFPNAMWLVLIPWVAPAAAGVGLATTVLVSMRVNTFQEASQLGGIVVLPLVAVVIGQATGVMYLSTGLVAVMGGFLWLIALLLLRRGMRAIRRTTLLTGRGSDS